MTNALKTPIQASLRKFTSTRANDFHQRMAKSMPAHVTKIDKDFAYVAFENKNTVFAMPTIKLPQSFSPYQREPTQPKEKGYCVPNDYYMGTVSGYGGGDTNFYPRGNLTTLSFQPVSHADNETRDYNQHTVTGGPTGVKIIQSLQAVGTVLATTAMTPIGGTLLSLASTAGLNVGMVVNAISNPLSLLPNSVISKITAAGAILNQGVQAAVQIGDQLNFVAQAVTGPPHMADMQRLPGLSTAAKQAWLRQRHPRPVPLASSSPKAYIEINKDGLLTHTSGDMKHQMLIDQQNKKVAINVPSQETVFVGGTGKQPSLYAPMVTVNGPMVDGQGKYVQQDD